MDPHPPESTIHTEAELRAALNLLKFRRTCVAMQWGFDIQAVYDMEVSPRPYTGQPMTIEMPEGHGIVRHIGWHINTYFARPDSLSGKRGVGEGRKEFVALGATVSAALKTGWVCCEMVVKHELMETVCIGDEEHPLFDPHKTWQQLAEPRWDEGTRR